MAKSIDPNQTAPSEADWSESALFAYAILLETLVFEILGHLQYVCLCWGFTAQSTQWGHVERGQFT